MEATAFQESIFISERERALSQLILQLALHEEVDDSLPTYLELTEAQMDTLKRAVTGYERELSNKSPTLASLLGQVSKSKCCT